MSTSSIAPYARTHPLAIRVRVEYTAKRLGGKYMVSLCGVTEGNNRGAVDPDMQCLMFSFLHK